MRKFANLAFSYMPPSGFFVFYTHTKLVFEKKEKNRVMLPLIAPVTSILGGIRHVFPPLNTSEELEHAAHMVTSPHTCAVRWITTIIFLKKLFGGWGRLWRWFSF